MLHIAVVGGGASGLAAAVSAAYHNPNVRIVIYEQKDKIGKKILATGHGRCNMTNRFIDSSCYYSDDRQIIDAVLSRFGYEETVDFFRHLGLITKNRGDYVYPRSGQAISVLQALYRGLSRYNIEIRTDTAVKNIQKTKNGYRLIAGCQTYYADKVILACGGKASSALGSDGSGYTLAGFFGHTLVPPVPALVQLKVKRHPFQKAAGVRTSARVTAFVSGQEIASDEGELQITDYGISGIPVFQISRFLSRAVSQRQTAAVSVDFAPEFSMDELTALLYELKAGGSIQTAADLLGSLFPEKLVPCLLKQADVPFRTSVSAISGPQMNAITCLCKSNRLMISATTGFENAQVCAGGVRTSQVNPYTMESIYAGGLYITGELLDVDGICGGYNLQWAWATGYIAGAAASTK